MKQPTTFDSNLIIARQQCKSHKLFCRP